MNRHQRECISQELEEKILGEMTETIVQFDTQNALDEKRYFVYKPEVVIENNPIGEYDMLVYDKIKNSYYCFEVKHTNNFYIGFNAEGVYDGQDKNLLNDVIRKVRDSYDHYNFIDVGLTLINFMTNTLSAFYMDYAKDILYVEAKDSKRRRQVQTVFYKCTEALVSLWAPILSYTAEEVYSFFKPDESSVFLTQFPTPETYDNQEDVRKQWEKFMTVRSDILKALEIAKTNNVMRKALETKVYLTLKEDYRDSVKGLSNHDLAQLVIASQFEVCDEIAGDEYESCYVRVEKFDGCTCPRCWNVVEHADEDGLCDRCHKIIYRNR